MATKTAKVLRKITVRQVINNIRKNGYEQAFGQMFAKELVDGKWVDTACALGQAQLNLNIKEYHVDYPANTNEDNNEFPREFTGRIVALNDNERRPLNNIADILEREFGKNARKIVWVVRDMDEVQQHYLDKYMEENEAW